MEYAVDNFKISATYSGAPGTNTSYTAPPLANPDYGKPSTYIAGGISLTGGASASVATMGGLVDDALGLALLTTLETASGINASSSEVATVSSTSLKMQSADSTGGISNYTASNLSAPDAVQTSQTEPKTSNTAASPDLLALALNPDTSNQASNIAQDKITATHLVMSDAAMNLTGQGSASHETFHETDSMVIFDMNKMDLAQLLVFEPEGRVPQPELEIDRLMQRLTEGQSFTIALKDLNCSEIFS